MAISFDWNNLVSNLSDLGKTIYLSETQRKALEKQIKSGSQGAGSSAPPVYYPVSAPPPSGSAATIDFSKYILPVGIAAVVFFIFKKYV